MKLLMMFLLLIALSAACAYIFTNPNKYSKCCEAPADQPLIGIFGICLYLAGLMAITAAFTMGTKVGYSAVGLWFLVYYVIRYQIKHEQREYKKEKAAERKRLQEMKKQHSWY